MYCKALEPKAERNILMNGKKQEVQINRKEFYKNLTRLALPIALQSLMLASVAAGDALMLGKVAQDEMTAVSLATQIQFVQNMFLGAVTAAGSILGAQYWGKGDRHTLEDVFNMMLGICGIVSVLFFLACELIPGLLMHIFTHDAALIAIGSSYLRIAGWSYLLTGISQCYLTIMKISDHAAPGALISSCAVILNICLNAVFIFGLLGAPQMQARGAALATTISRPFYHASRITSPSAPRSTSMTLPACTWPARIYLAAMVSTYFCR